METTALAPRKYPASGGSVLEQIVLSVSALNASSKSRTIISTNIKTSSATLALNPLHLKFVFVFCRVDQAKEIPFKSPRRMTETSIENDSGAGETFDGPVIEYELFQPDYLPFLDVINPDKVSKAEQVMAESAKRGAQADPRFPVQDVKRARAAPREPTLKTLIYVLVKASGDGDLQRVKELIEDEKVPIASSIAESGGVNALHMACFHGRCNVIQWLLENGLDIEIYDRKGQRALHYAVKGCRKDVLKLLVEYGVEMNSVSSPNNWTALQIAAVKKDCFQCVKFLVGHGADMNHQDSTGATALHNCVARTDQLTEVIIYLASHKDFNWTIRTQIGFSVFMVAVVWSNRRSHSDVVAYLLEKDNKCATEVFSSSQMTALHYTSFLKNSLTAKLLLSHFERVGRTQSSASSSEGESPPANFDALRSPEVDRLTTDGTTPLLISCIKADYAMVTLLVQAGARVTTVDCNGNTTLISVARCSKKTISPPTESVPDIHNFYKLFKDDPETMMHEYPVLSIICYLMQRGNNEVDFEAVNKQGQDVASCLSPDLAIQTKIKKFLGDFARNQIEQVKLMTQISGEDIFGEEPSPQGECGNQLNPAPSSEEHDFHDPSQ